MKEECNFEVEKSVSLWMELASCLQHAGHCWTSVISQMYTSVYEYLKGLCTNSIEAISVYTLYVSCIRIQDITL